MSGKASAAGPGNRSASRRASILAPPGASMTHHRRRSTVKPASGGARGPGDRGATAAVASEPPLDPQAQALVDKLGITAREYMELYEVFRLVDKDGGGTISKDELELLMQTLGIRASKVELEAMVNEIVMDPSRDEIDLEAFITAMSRKVTTSLPQDALLAAFRLFDEGGAIPAGRVRTPDLFRILESMGNADRHMRRDDVEDLLSSVAPQALESGHFDYDSFVRMLFSS